MRFSKYLQLFFVGCFSLVFIFPVNAQSKKDNNKNALKVAAKVKKQVFRLLWDELKDRQLAEKQIESLHQERIQIKIALEKLEFLAKLKSKQEEKPASIIAQQDQDREIQ